MTARIVHIHGGQAARLTDTVYEVTSFTTPGLVYGVAVQGPGVAWCGCPRYQREGRVDFDCKHITKAREYIAQEVRAQQEAATTEDREQARQRVAAIAEQLDR